MAQAEDSFSALVANQNVEYFQVGRRLPTCSCDFKTFIVSCVVERVEKPAFEAEIFCPEMTGMSGEPEQKRTKCSS
jgi:hypothetical protein